jgi:hypothetical protein
MKFTVSRRTSRKIGMALIYHNESGAAVRDF